MVCFPKTFLLNLQIVYCSPNPRSITTSGLGSSYFARHYFRNRVFFLFLWVLRCFSSPRYLLSHYFTHVMVIRLLPLIEFPHSDIYGYNGYLLLPVAFRSLSRPSSALGAQAFTLRSLQLNLLTSAKLRFASSNFKKYSSMYYLYTFLIFFSFSQHYSFILCHILGSLLIITQCLTLPHYFGLLYSYEYSSLPLFTFFYIFFNVLFKIALKIFDFLEISQLKF